MHTTKGSATSCLNAPYGARCFLTLPGRPTFRSRLTTGLNASYGARCFLTHLGAHTPGPECRSLNAPYGARCFLTAKEQRYQEGRLGALMHLMALGAF